MDIRFLRHALALVVVVQSTAVWPVVAKQPGCATIRSYELLRNSVGCDSPAVRLVVGSDTITIKLDTVTSYDTFLDWDRGDVCYWLFPDSSSPCRLRLIGGMVDYEESRDYAIVVQDSGGLHMVRILDSDRKEVLRRIYKARK